MKLSIQSFLGIAPRVPPRYLPDGGAQIATNVEATGQSVKPLTGMSLLRSLSSPGGVIQTIYRFGQDLDNELEHWFRWTTEVDVCRSQIAGDAAEWTCYTGDGAYPKATTNEIATQGGTTYPIQALRLGLPAPTERLTGTVALPQYCEVAGVLAGERDTEARCEAAGICKVNGTYNGAYTTKAACEAVTGGVWTTQTPGVWIVGAKESPAKITLTATILAAVTTDYGIKLSTNNGANFEKATVTTGNSFPAVSCTLTHIDQMTETYGIKVSIDNGLTWATSPLNHMISRSANLTLGASEIASMPYQTFLDITVFTQALGNTVARIDAKKLTTAAALVAAINSMVPAYNSVAPGTLAKATLQGSSVYVTSVAQGADVVLRLAWAANAYRTADGSDQNGARDQLVAAVQAAQLNGVPLVTATHDRQNGSPVVITSRTAGAGVKLVVKWGDSASMQLSDTGAALNLDALVTAINALSTNATYTGATAEKKNDTIVISSVKVGKDATLRARWGEATSQLLTATGVTADLGTKETRVYTYTWVLYESNVSWESAPCALKFPATFDVYAGGSVTLSGFPAALPAGGWGPVKGFLKQRLYRAVNGVYLFVAEITPGATFVDDLAADELGEALPSALWTPPKTTLKGIINLPNGMIAGFVGRDVCFSEPYRPYAWPDTYIMTVDYPIVGLGRMDTTLVVLTMGVPYFIQGSAPDVAVMVKSDIEQACVSKRSIVSMGGTVLYASPDGIMALSSSGSTMLTDGLFTRAQWQDYDPASIHAYGHDSQYIAFSSQGGFVIDLKTKQFIVHNLPATCGYTDLRNDNLYLGDSSNNLNKWYAGAPTTGRWRSKKFSHPQPLGYTCAQIEAESYPLTCRVYCDGVQVKAQAIPNSTYYSGTFLIAKRAPFRLPVAHGRDWEVELDVNQEIFNVVLAQAPSELATA